MKPSAIAEALETLIPNREPVLLVGPPGVGKTDVMGQVAERVGFDYIVSHPAVADPTDYKGMPYASADGKAEFLPFGDLYTIIHAERPTLFFADDVGQAPPAVQAAIMPLFLARAVNGHRIADCVTLAGATNRREDRAGVTTILEPVKSRFTTILHMEPDLTDWIGWALRNDLPMEIIAFIRWKPETLTAWEPTGDIRNTPCPRTIANAARVWSQGQGWSTDTLFGALAGSAGEGFATEFLAFTRVWRDLPDIDSVLDDPDGAPVPADLAVRYALCGALTARSSDVNADRIVRFADRLAAERPNDGGPEQSVVLVTDCARRPGTGFAETRAYVEWCAAHPDILVN